VSVALALKRERDGLALGGQHLEIGGFDADEGVAPVLEVTVPLPDVRASLCAVRETLPPSARNMP
jgi:hypothetical protein